MSRTDRPTQTLEAAHPSRLPTSRPLVPQSAQQLGSGAPQPRHGGPKPGQLSER